MRREGFCNAMGTCVVALLLPAFLFVTVNGLFVSCAVEIFFSPDNNEHVVFLANKPLQLIALVLAAIVLIRLLLRCNITRTWVNVCTIAALVATTALSLWWLSQAKAVPYADSRAVLDAALALSAGNAKALAQSDYFLIYPFQFGFVRYAELMAKAFGADALYTTLAIGNVVCLNAIYLALLCITRRLFDDVRVELVTAILLMLCLQPAFLCTFLYGVYPGLALALWGSYFTIRFLREERLWLLLPAALLLACAILLKQNNKLLLIANILALLLYVLRRKRIAALGGIACMLLLAALLPALVQKRYEERADFAFGKGTPLTAWLVMGLSESSFCSGWFNSYQLTVMPDNDYNTDAAAEQIRADVMERVRLFASRPRYMASFFYHKLTSQWNEPAFQSIWSSAAGPHSGSLEPAAFSISYGEANRALSRYFNVYDQLIYFGFVTALFILWKKERRTDALLVLPVTILGIFLYHALFEAKAQYALPPFLMMLPYAAYGLTTLLSKKPKDNAP